MLVVTRKIGEQLMVGDARITVIAGHGGRIRLGIDAPPTIRVWRAELTNGNHRRAGTIVGDEKLEGTWVRPNGRTRSSV